MCVCVYVCDEANGWSEKKLNVQTEIIRFAFGSISYAHPMKFACRVRQKRTLIFDLIRHFFEASKWKNHIDQHVRVAICFNLTQKIEGKIGINNIHD